MTYKVSFKPSNLEIEVAAEDFILDAGIRQGLDLPYSCRNGECGTCMVSLIKGDVKYSEEDYDKGKILLCQAKPLSDLEIESEQVILGNRAKPQIYPAQVEKFEKLASDVVRIFLKLPRGKVMQFEAGQYLDILLTDGRRRSFSIANAGGDNTSLELHIRHVVDGFYTSYVFSDMKEKDVIRIEGPFGNFGFDSDHIDRPLIFMAGGTGFAPIKAITEHIRANNLAHNIFLYWGARSYEGFYLNDLVKEWAAESDSFKFIPVLSDAMPEDNWHGRTGFVHEAILSDFDDLSGYNVYACGPPAMIDAGKVEFIERGLSEEHYYSDAFTFQ